MKVGEHWKLRIDWQGCTYHASLEGGKLAFIEKPMRHWIFHPLIFYPLAILLAAAVIVFGLQPQSWPREPKPVAAQVSGGSLVFAEAAFDAPDKAPEQSLHVTRDFWGNAQSLRIAVLPNQPEPTPAEQGVRILLTPEQAAMIEDRPVSVVVSYQPLGRNTASGLAVSLQGIGPADWAMQPLPSEPGPGQLQFELPAQFAVNAIGLRALSSATDQNYGLEITRVVVTPR